MGEEYNFFVILFYRTKMFVYVYLILLGIHKVCGKLNFVDILFAKISLTKLYFCQTIFSGFSFLGTED